MRDTTRTHRAKTSTFAAAVALSFGLFGCGGPLDDDYSSVEVTWDSPVSKSTYDGEVAFKMMQSIDLGEQAVPLTVYLGLSPETDTRMLARSFVDLRDLQEVIIDAVPPEAEVDCSLGLDVDVRNLVADGSEVRASGTVVARLYRCRGKDSAAEVRGSRLISATIDLAIGATAKLEDQCVAFSITDLALAPRGFLGGVANVTGITKRAQAAIMEKGAAYLDDNKICPDPPGALETLDPRFDAARPKEIETGGLGAELAGSFDTSAGTILSLLDVVKERGIVEGLK